MNMPATRETTQLPYNKDYNDGYAAGFLSTQKVNYDAVIHSLDNDADWYKRENSARAIMRILFIGVFVFAFAALLITVTVLGVISLVLESGMRWYVSLAPLALAIVIGYIVRGRRQ